MGRKWKIVEEPLGTPELEEFAEVYQEKKGKVDRGFITMFVKSINAMKIVRLLHNTKSDLYIVQIGNACHIYGRNTRRYLQRLAQAGIIERFIPTPVTMKKIFYRIPDRTLTEKMIRRYYWISSFQLANCISFNGTTFEELRGNREFYDLCQKYALTFEEAIEALKLNEGKIKLIYSEKTGEHGKILAFKRLPTYAEGWSFPQIPEKEPVEVGEAEEKHDVIEL